MRWSENQLTEGKVQGLGGEVTDDVGGVSSPEGEETLIFVGTSETVNNTLVRVAETTLLDLLQLVNGARFVHVLKHEPSHLDSEPKA